MHILQALYVNRNSHKGPSCQSILIKLDNNPPKTSDRYGDRLIDFPPVFMAHWGYLWPVLTYKGLALSLHCVLK